MPIGPDSYFRRRERQERNLARAAGDPTIRAIHLTLAEHYAIRALAGDDPDPRVPPACALPGGG